MTFGEFYDIIKNKAVEKLFSPSSAITELLPQNNREGSIVNINEMTVLICDDSMFARKKLSMSISGFGVKAVYKAHLHHSSPRNDTDVLILLIIFYA